LQAQQREANKQLRQAGTAKWALQQVRLLVDSQLASSEGGGLGISMLSE
jgi:hypothetical protein